MALQIRRGTNAERLTITPAEGELIYTTDTKQLYVGDGSTVGGTKADTGITSILDDATPQLGGPLDLNSQNITGVGNIQTSGNITTSGIISSSSANFTSITFGEGVGNFSGSVFADDSSILVDGISGKINLSNTPLTDLQDVAITSLNDGDVLQYNVGTGQWSAGPIGTTSLSGNFTGSVFSDDSTVKIDGISGEVFGPFIGDLKGSVFGDDSSIVVDGISGNILPAAIIAVGNRLNINPETTGDNQVKIVATDDRGVLNLTRSSNSDISGNTTDDYGAIFFARDDSLGERVVTLIRSKRDGLYFANDNSGSFATEENYFSFVALNFGIGTTSPAEKLDVKGNAIISGNVHAASFTGTYTADDSTIIVDGIDKSANLSTIVASGFVQFGSYTTTNRNNLTAANGMVLYNTSVNRFQGYQNGGWINLDDGTAA